MTNDREKWRERVRDIRASGTTWWWWWWWWWCHILPARRGWVNTYLRQIKIIPFISLLFGTDWETWDHTVRYELTNHGQSASLTITQCETHKQYSKIILGIYRERSHVTETGGHRTGQLSKQQLFISWAVPPKLFGFTFFLIRCGDPLIIYFQRWPRPNCARWIKDAHTYTR